MKADPIMEELWTVKDKLAREAGYDADRFIEDLRQWESLHSQPGRVVRTADELRRYVAEEERKSSSLALNDAPSRKD